MACRNCGDRGGRYVRDLNGEAEWEPCNECSTFDQHIALHKRCDKAREAIRQLGHNVWISRNEVLVLIHGITITCQPKPNGEWHIEAHNPDASVLAPIRAALRTS